MSSLDAIGLLINPKAGQGFGANARIARMALAALCPARVVTGPEELGAAALEANGPAVTVLPVAAAPGRAQTQALARALAALPLAMILVIGGDGTLADTACALIGHAGAPALVGIGVGSTNAGLLITCRADQLDQLAIARLAAVPLRGLLAYQGENLLGVGFNDCVLGFTVVGTLDGQIQDMDAAAKMHGQSIPGSVRPVGTRSTRVERVGPEGTVKIASGSQVATVVVGFAERAFFAKAVTGGVCLASLVNAPAGCLVSDQPLVRIGVSLDQVLAMPPVNSAFLPFDERYRIHVRGMRPGTAVCVDGNPVRLLAPQDTVSFGVAQEAIYSMQLV